MKEIPDRWNKFIGMGKEIAPFGANFEEYQEFYQRTQDWNQEDIRQHQLEKLQELVKHCYENVPYYRELFDREGIDPEIESFEEFRQIPVLDKEEILENPERFLAEDFGQYFPVYFSSSGTTGQKLELYLSRDAWDIEKAAIWRHFNLAGYEYGEPGIMFYPFDPGMEQDQIYNPFLKWHILDGQVVNEEIAEKHLEKIEEVEPKCVQSYPSILYEFCKILDSKDIQLEIPITLTTSEPLYDAQKQLIEDVLNTEIYDWYGLNEHVAAAYHCEEHRHHLNERYAFVEFVGDSPRKKVVGTNLYNYAMPLLRYDTGDFGDVSEGDCECGRPTRVMEQVIGRQREIIKTEKGDYILRHSFFLLKDPDVEKFQIVQKSLQDIQVYIVPENSLDQEKIESIEQKLYEFLDDTVEIEIEVVDEIDGGGSDKRQYFISEMEDE